LESRKTMLINKHCQLVHQRFLKEKKSGQRSDWAS
jgi:hypothetical protein